MIKVDGNILHYVVGYCGRQEQLQLLVASLIQPLVFMCLPTQVLINKVIIVKCIVFITLLQSLCNYLLLIKIIMYCAAMKYVNF